MQNMQIFTQKMCFGSLIGITWLSSLFLTLPLVAAPYDLIDLGTSLGGERNYVYGINELDEVTGYSDGAIIPDDQVDTENPPSICQLANGTSAYQEFCNHAYLYSNGVMTDLGDFSLDRSFGIAINDNSTIVGFALAEHDDGDEETINLTHDKAFISFAGGLIESLPFPDESNDLAETVTPNQRALDISNDRKIVGYSLVGFTDDAEVQNSVNRPYLYNLQDQKTLVMQPLVFLHQDHR